MEYSVREKASKELDAIGLPALKHCARLARVMMPRSVACAEDLVKKLEKQVLTAKILAPTRLHLKYQDTPVQEAVADMAKQSKFTITLLDPQNKLAGRKVTLDTGDVPFWEAFDQFCQKAGLVINDGTQGVLVPEPMPQPAPPVRRPPIIRPVPQCCRFSSWVVPMAEQGCCWRKHRSYPLSPSPHPLRCRSPLCGRLPSASRSQWTVPLPWWTANPKQGRLAMQVQCAFTRDAWQWSSGAGRPDNEPGKWCRSHAFTCRA